MEVFNSFFNNIKDKLTNPFFGTLILVLITHHWELWYAVFNFDSVCNLDDKLNFVKNYISVYLTFKSFMWDLALAVFYMFLGYLVVVATRSLVLWVEFWLMPFITGKIVNKNVVKRTEYDDIVKEREQYFDQYEEQRKNVRNFSKAIDEQTDQIKKKDEDLLKQSDIISTTVRELDAKKSQLERTQTDNENKTSQIAQLNDSLEQLQKSYDFLLQRLDTYGHIFFGDGSEQFYSSPEKFPPEIYNKVKELKNEDKWQEFISLGNFFEYGGSLSSGVLTDMIKRGLAFDRGSREELTPLGSIIYHYRKVFGVNI